MLSVDFVVACHDGARRGIGDSDLKGQQMNLAQSSLAHDGIDANSLMLLVVCGEMLDCGYHAGGLDTSDVRGGKFTGGIWVLRERLKPSAPKGRPLDTHCGS